MLLEDVGPKTPSAIIVVETDRLSALNLATELAVNLRKGKVPVGIIAEGSMKKRYDRAMKTNSDYILTVTEGVTPDTVAVKFRRVIIDRHGRKGSVYGSLRRMMKSKYEISNWNLSHAVKTSKMIEIPLHFIESR
jgi:hypothetical protein